MIFEKLFVFQRMNVIERIKGKWTHKSLYQTLPLMGQNESLACWIGKKKTTIQPATNGICWWKQKETKRSKKKKKKEKQR